MNYNLDIAKFRTGGPLGPHDALERKTNPKTVNERNDRKSRGSSELSHLATLPQNSFPYKQSKGPTYSAN